MRKKPQSDSFYRVALGSAMGILRLLVYVLLIFGIFYIGKATYQFGYLVFDQKPVTVSEDNVQAVTVVIDEKDSVYDIGKILKEKGLIERADVFWVQEKLSDYDGKIQPGTYLLNSSQTVDEMLAVMSPEEEESDS